MIFVVLDYILERAIAKNTNDKVYNPTYRRLIPIPPMDIKFRKGREIEYIRLKTQETNMDEKSKEYELYILEPSK